MTTEKYSIEIVHSEEFGELAMFIQGMRKTTFMYESQSGMTIAHDILEHVNGLNQIGGFEDELQAIGAITVGRYANDKTRMVDITTELCNNFLYFEQSDRETLRYEEQPKSDEYEEEFVEALCLMDEGLEEEVNEEKLKQFKKAAIHLLREGETKFRARFAKFDAYPIEYAVELFERIEKEVNYFFKDGLEGDILNITIDSENGLECENEAYEEMYY